MCMVQCFGYVYAGTIPALDNRKGCPYFPPFAFAITCSATALGGGA